jgi:predicted ribosomally synthesized peptide with SipW-like signal peptide
MKNMRGYLFSILIVGIALGGIGLGTFAWFTDQDVKDGNTITAGTADLGVWLYNAAGTGISKFQVTGLHPGEYKTLGYVAVKNIGTSDLKWRAYLVKTDGTTLPIVVTVKALPTDFTGTLPSGPTYGPAPDTVTVTDATWSVLSSAANTPLNSGTEYAMLPGYVQYFKIDAKLADTAGNSYQGASMTVDLVFDSTQFINPGWTQ